MAEKTIAAIATALSPAGIGVIRISGDDALTIADRIFRSVSGKPLSDQRGYTAAFGKVYAKGEPLDEAVALVFRAPKSYTGENVVEFSVHGGIYIQRTLLREILAQGATPAAPGEFTKRAFLNGKLDLAEAESVAAIIGAGNADMLKASLAAKEGAVTAAIGGIKEKLLAAAASVAAYSDYPDEEPEFSGIGELPDRLSDIFDKLSKLLADYDNGKVMREGISAAIVGRPNVGKSTLMNMLVGDERSIVTDISGTTRDVIEETVDIGGIKLCLSDTAGIRKTDDIIENMGVKRSEKKIDTAQLILAVFDGSRQLDEYDFGVLERIVGKNVIAVMNKTDLDPCVDAEKIKSYGFPLVSISAKNGDGIDELCSLIRHTVAGVGLSSNSVLLSSERQRDCAQRALNAVEEALNTYSDGMTVDAVGVCVDEALNALMELTGERVTVEVTNEVFKKFCVGK